MMREEHDSLEDSSEPDNSKDTDYEPGKESEDDQHCFLNAPSDVEYSDLEDYEDLATDSGDEYSGDDDIVIPDEEVSISGSTSGPSHIPTATTSTSVPTLASDRKRHRATRSDSRSADMHENDKRPRPDPAQANSAPKNKNKRAQKAADDAAVKIWAKQLLSRYA